jgi:hypothetical protein
MHAPRTARGNEQGISVQRWLIQQFNDPFFTLSEKALNMGACSHPHSYSIRFVQKTIDDGLRFI